MGDPLSVRPSEDSGAATQDRFSWQHHCIAIDCIQMVMHRRASSIVCEIHEDYVVQLEGGPFELVSCKHRDADRGRWKLRQMCVDGGLGHLFGSWYTFRDAAVRLMTNAALAEGPAEARAVAAACGKASEGNRFDQGMSQCRDALARGLLAAGRLKGFAGIPQTPDPGSRRAALAEPIPDGFLGDVEQFMRVLSIKDKVHSRLVIEDVLIRRDMKRCLSRLGFHTGSSEECYRQLVELIHSKNMASPLTEAYGELLISRGADTSTGLHAATVGARTIRADDVYMLISNWARRVSLAPPGMPTLHGNLSSINTREGLVNALVSLFEQAQLSLSELERRESAMAAHDGRSLVLDRESLVEVINRRRLPTLDFLLACLEVLDVPAENHAPWTKAWQRAAADDIGSRHSVFVRDALPLSLGIHVAISSSSEALPVYVRRDCDLELREALSPGSFVLLVGPSSAGKTRTLYEAVRAEMPDWALLQPSDVDGLLQLAAAPAKRSVLWLDELQRYLGGEPALNSGTISKFTSAGAVVVGTMWLSEYTKLMSSLDEGESDPGPQRHVLADAKVVEVPATLSTQEQSRAAQTAMVDDRIRKALSISESRMAQALAGAPALERWWSDLTDPFVSAVVVAAADARRLGVQGPVSRAFLAEAALGYLHPAERLLDPSLWLDDALAKATTALTGNVSPLVRVASGPPNRADGYRVEEPLQQYLAQTRRIECPPHSTWTALISHTKGVSEMRRIVASAQTRMRYRYCEPLLRKLSAAGDGQATADLAGMLFSHDRIDDAIRLLEDHLQTYGDDDLRVIAKLEDLRVLQEKLSAPSSDASPPATAKRRELLADQGRTELLRVRANAGDSIAADLLADLLAERGQIGELEERTNNGDRFSADRLAQLYARQGNVEALRVWARRGKEAFRFQLAKALAAVCSVDELGSLAASGDRFAVHQLKALASGQADRRIHDQEGTGKASERIALLRSEVELGKAQAAERLTALMHELGNMEGLWAETDAGTLLAAERLINLFVARNIAPAHLLHTVRVRGLSADGAVQDAGWMI